MRHLVVGNPVLAERLDFCLVGFFSFLQSYPGTELFAVFVIRNTEYRNVLYLVVAVQELFDFARIDILAPPDHHVLHAPDNVAISFLIKGGEVTRMHPASRIYGFPGLVLLIPVTQHDVITTGT